MSSSEESFTSGGSRKHNKRTKLSNSKTDNNYRKQRFNDAWLELDCFKGWLCKTEDVFKCKCEACDKILHCGKSEIKKHASTKLHQRNVTSIKNSRPVNSFFEKKQTAQSVDRETTNFEIKLSLFFAEHNVAFQIVEHLIPLLKAIVPDSKIIKNAQLGRKKCTSIIKNVLAKQETDELVAKLKKYNFSIMIDESTDIGLNKSMCVLVRFFDDEEGRIVVRLLDLLRVESDCSSEALYRGLKDLILNNNIPFENIIGMCSDGASVMVGQNNSFASRLIADNKNAVVIKCICHSAAIIANKACLTLPRAPEELLRQIGNYVSGSSKRCLQLQQFQELLHEKKKKILRTSATRWLSHQKCIERILENWNVLMEYFKHAVVSDKLKSAELILNDLTNECNKAYLFFLKYVLGYFNTLNALFQSKRTLIHELHNESTKIFFQLGQNFIKRSELKVNCIVRSPHVTLQVEEIYLGPECDQILKSIPKAAEDKIRLDCLNFYITALEEIQQRLPIKNANIFKEFGFLDPKVVVGLNGNRSEFSFELLSQMLSLDINLLSQEWRTIEFSFLEKEKSNLAELEVVQFWNKVCQTKNFNEETMFPNLSTLAKHVLALPHANADAERIFSVVTDVRTKKRNKLSHENLNSICVIRSSLQDENLNCVSFQIKEDHVKKMSSNILYDHHM